MTRLITLLFFASRLAFATDMHGYCGANSNLFNITDRPSYADSVCAVPFGKHVVELGYQAQQMYIPHGESHNFPDLEYRVGIPLHNEIFLIIPNRIQQSVAPHSGFSSGFIGFKHTFDSKTDTLLFAVEGWTGPPNGSRNFGNGGWNGTVAGIITYNFKIPLSWTLMLSASSLTQPNALGGNRYESVNPDFVLSYLFTPKFSAYIEAYGQSKPAPHATSGFNLDGGVLFLPKKDFQFDISAGQRLQGNFGNFENYISIGMAFMF